MIILVSHKKAEMDTRLLNLNFDNVRDMSIQLAEKVAEKPDLVAFVARGSYLIGQTIAEYFHVPLLETKAERKGNRLKHLIQPILGHLPDGIKTWLRKKEIKTGTHARNRERRVTVHIPEAFSDHNFERILLVDDAVDTGNTILSVKAELQRIFPQAHVDTAAFAVFDESKAVVKTDYCLYENTLLSAPWSSDSQYYREFVLKYETYKSEGVF